MNKTYREQTTAVRLVLDNVLDSLIELESLDLEEREILEDLINSRSGEYPFDRSFDEVLADMYEFIEEIFNEL